MTQRIRFFSPGSTLLQPPQKINLVKFVFDLIQDLVRRMSIPDQAVVRDIFLKQRRTI